MEEIIEKEALYIPQGLKKKREYFDGYGWNEFKITLISVIVTLGICVPLYLCTKNLVMVVFLIMALPATTVLFVIKNGNNISVVDQIMFMVRFAKEQKYYPYVYRDELAHEYT